MKFKLSLVLATALAGAAFALPGVGAKPAQKCNGHSELCSRRYTDITFVGAHDSSFVGDEVADNQDISIPEQLAMRVRFLQAQTHLKDGQVHMCHTYCDLKDAGPLDGMLASIVTFLDANPNEVLTLLLTNQDGIGIAAYDAAFKGVGLDKYAFAPDPGMSLAEWPSLGEMIQKGKRLVVFMDYPRGSVPYILNEFNRYMVETPFEYDELRDLSICPIDRPSGRADAQDRMLLMNHWLQINLSDGVYVPARCMSQTTNSKDIILGHAQACTEALQKKPNFILLDWIDAGDAMLVQDTLNGVKPIPRVTPPRERPVECDEDEYVTLGMARTS